jgi:DNA-binding transcriptional LysR family regulator
MFVAVAATGGLRRAATRLGVTPPAVSLQMRNLERDYHVPLFERGTRRVRLTDAGEVFHRYATQILALLHDAEHALEGAQGVMATKLRVAATATTASYYLDRLWRPLAGKHPALGLELSVQNSRGVKERLLGRDADIGMLGGSVEEPDIVLQPFAEDPLVVIVAPAHPWAGRHRVDAGRLAEQRLILREPGSATRELVQRTLRTLNIEPLATMEVASTEAIKRAVEIGAGVGILAASVVRRDVRGGYLRMLRLGGCCPTLTLSFAHHRDCSNPRLLRMLLETIANDRVSGDASSDRRRLPRFSPPATRR